MPSHSNVWVTFVAMKLIGWRHKCFDNDKLFVLSLLLVPKYKVWPDKCNSADHSQEVTIISGFVLELFVLCAVGGWYISVNINPFWKLFK